MFLKPTAIAILAFSAGMFLAPAAGAGTFNGATHSRAEAVSMGGSFAFDTPDQFSTADLLTGSTAAAFPTNPALGGVLSFQGMSEVNLGGTVCTFTGVFGEKETGVNSAWVGSTYAADGPSGSFFEEGVSGSGCYSISTGKFTFTETDTIFAGTGIYRGVKGSATVTWSGITLGPPGGGTGIF